eukprot:Amastigsp_a342519_35.p1 type:complete len:506 gc:universal Amastigsp_a342519_35:1-1518(+)
MGVQEANDVGPAATEAEIKAARLAALAKKGIFTVAEKKRRVLPCDMVKPAFRRPPHIRSLAQDMSALPAPPPTVPEAIEDSFANVPDTEDSIVVVAQGPGPAIVKAGTLTKLIERLTYERYPDPEFMLTFLLTYRSFTRPIDLLELLIARYDMSTPVTRSQAAYESFVNEKLTIVRLRVFNVLKNWADKHSYDFADADGELLSKLHDFLRNTMARTNMERAAQQIMTLVEKRVGSSSEFERVMSTAPPRPEIAPGFDPASEPLTRLSAVEIARQITLIEHRLYCQIRPWECLGQAWTHEPKSNIRKLILQFNQTSQWVAMQVLTTESLRERKAVLTHFVQIAAELRALNNFNAVLEIVAGLEFSPLYRLKHTWASLSKKTMETFESLRELVSRAKNFKNHRAAMRTVHPPVIPYLGITLTDLTFIEDGNSDLTPSGLINFEKRNKVAKEISTLMLYQQTPYCLTELPAVRDWLLQVFQTPYNEAVAFELSLKREPRESTLKDIVQ